MGKKRQPIYKVVATDVRAPRDGRFIEAIGLYNPKTEPATIELDEERANYWLNVGAQPTDTVKNLLSRKGILFKRELQKQGLSEEEVNTKLEEWFKEKELKVAEAKKKAEEKAKKEAKAKENKAEATGTEEKAEEKSAESE